MTEEKYKVIKIPIWKIKKMLKSGTWKDSLEQEEVVYNLQHNLYSENYTNKVSKLLCKE